MSTMICRGFLGVGGPVDLAAQLLDRGFELFEVAIEVGERVLLDLLGVIAQPLLSARAA